MGKLTDTKLKSIKVSGKYFDGEGLHLHVLASGGKSWRIDYRHEGKAKTITIGKYPSTTLAMARKILAEVKLKLQANIDPIAEKQKQRAVIQAEQENLFENIVEQWLEVKHSDKTPKHRQDIISKLDRFVYPTFKGRNINSISSKEMLDCIRKVEAKGIYETAKKTLGICNQVFSFAVGEGKADNNICGSLGKQLKSVKVKHLAFITDRALLGKLLNDIDQYPHGILVKIALQIAPYVFLRPSELINATWQEISFEDALWIIPEERMKLRRKHLVPLSFQVIGLLKELHELTGETQYLFANWNTRNKPITIDGLRQGLRRLGYGADVVTTHGFRHTASTMLNELGFNRDHIERQLAHATGDTVRGTYNHAEWLAERRELMQDWADFLDSLKV